MSLRGTSHRYFARLFAHESGRLLVQVPFTGGLLENINLYSVGVRSEVQLAQHDVLSRLSSDLTDSVLSFPKFP